MRAEYADGQLPRLLGAPRRAAKSSEERAILDTAGAQAELLHAVLRLDEPVRTRDILGASDVADAEASAISGLSPQGLHVEGDLGHWQRPRVLQARARYGAITVLGDVDIRLQRSEHATVVMRAELHGRVSLLLLGDVLRDVRRALHKGILCKETLMFSWVDPYVFFSTAFSTHS